MEYILFVFRDANFETVRLLAPYYQYKDDDNYKKLQEKVEILSVGGEKIKVFYHYFNKEKTDNGFRLIPTQVDDISLYLDKLMTISRDGCQDQLDWEDDEQVRREIKQEFLSKYPDHIFDLSDYLKNRFDPIECYKELKDLTEVNGKTVKIVDGLVVLDKYI